MIELKPVSIPAFGVPLIRPLIPAQTYALRCDTAYAAAGTDWLFVYADREHNANILHLTGFDPRFEEAVLLLGPNGRRIIVTGNESLSFTAISPLPGVEAVLAQSLSLMAQPRGDRPSLEVVLRDAGLKAGETVGIVGWKYLEPEEYAGEHPGYFIPHFMVSLLARIVGGVEAISDKTAVLMHPETGGRAVVDADQIAISEWAATRASASVWNVVQNTRPGQLEIEAAANTLFAGEPLATHTMFASGTAGEMIHGVGSAGSRRLSKGDGVTHASGYWGALASRAGQLDDSNDEFVEIAKRYFAALVTWYETADIGVTGGVLHDTVVEKLAEGGLKPALNPGHLVNYDEWMHSPVRPGSTEKIRSGMVFQVDVIPTPTPSGTALNCEDAVVFADADLRAELAAKHPEAWARIEARRAFMAKELGVTLKDSILPLSNTPLCLPPLWLANHLLLVNA